MAYHLGFDWKVTDNDGWSAPRKWGKFTRSAGILVWVSAEQNERLLALEDWVRVVEAKTVALAAAAHPRLNDKWSDRVAQEIMARLRRDMEASDYPVGSTTFVASDRAANRILQACRARHKRALPIGGIVLRTPSLRLACGLHYGVAVGRLAEGKDAWSLGGLGIVRPEPSAALAGVEGCAYAEVSRVESSWRVRFTWMKETASLPQSVASVGAGEPPPVSD